MLLAAFGLTLTADLLSKAAAAHFLGDSVVPIVGAAKLRILYNADAPIGLGNSLAGILALSLAGLAVAAIAVWAWKTRSSRSLYAGIMIGGAAGNLFDRLIGGSDLDWIDGGFGGVFNLADVAIVIGLLLFLSANSDDSSSEDQLGLHDEAPILR